MRTSKQLQQLADQLDDLAVELMMRSDFDSLEVAAQHCYAAADELAAAIKILKRAGG